MLVLWGIVFTFAGRRNDARVAPCEQRVANDSADLQGAHKHVQLLLMRFRRTISTGTPHGVRNASPYRDVRTVLIVSMMSS